MNPLNRRPEKTEYFEYYDRYIQLVPDGEIVEILRAQTPQTLDLLRGTSAAAADFRYAPGKWSLMEVLGHIIDTEWIFTYRALSFARGESGLLPKIDPDAYMANADFSARTVPALLEQFRHLRSANTLLFENFNNSALDRTGTASGYSFTTRAVLYVIAGHELHHMNVVKERYLGHAG
jgi:uncharacterized damage-inducible protein DinB